LPDETNVQKAHNKKNPLTAAKHEIPFRFTPPGEAEIKGSVTATWSVRNARWDYVVEVESTAEDGEKKELKPNWTLAKGEMGSAVCSLQATSLRRQLDLPPAITENPEPGEPQLALMPVLHNEFEKETARLEEEVLKGIEGIKRETQEKIGHTMREADKLHSKFQSLDTFHKRYIYKDDRLKPSMVLGQQERGSVVRKIILSETIKPISLEESRGWLSWWSCEACTRASPEDRVATRQAQSSMF
jgi:hypothetical protein